MTFLQRLRAESNSGNLVASEFLAALRKNHTEYKEKMSKASDFEEVSAAGKIFVETIEKLENQWNSRNI